VFQIVRAQFEQSGAPRTFWPEAVASAVDILNRTTVAPHDRCSSYEDLTGQAPRVMSIMPWGCRMGRETDAQQDQHRLHSDDGHQLRQV